MNSVDVPPSVCSLLSVVEEHGDDLLFPLVSCHSSNVGYTKAELMATGPNQTWSWDITKLLGPKKRTYFYLYVVLDIFSRYAVGWMVADRENSALAGRLIEQTCH